MFFCGLFCLCCVVLSLWGFCRAVSSAKVADAKSALKDAKTAREAEEKRKLEASTAKLTAKHANKKRRFAMMDLSDDGVSVAPVAPVGPAFKNMSGLANSLPAEGDYT